MIERDTFYNFEPLRTNVPRILCAIQRAGYSRTQHDMQISFIRQLEAYPCGRRPLSFCVGETRLIAAFSPFGRKYDLPYTHRGQCPTAVQPRRRTDPSKQGQDERAMLGQRLRRVNLAAREVHLQRRAVRTPDWAVPTLKESKQSVFACLLSSSKLVLACLRQPCHVYHHDLHIFDVSPGQVERSCVRVEFEIPPRN